MMLIKLSATFETLVISITVPDKFESCGRRLSNIIGNFHDRREDPRRNGADGAAPAVAARRDAVQLVGGGVDALGTFTYDVRRP